MLDDRIRSRGHLRAEFAFRGVAVDLHDSIVAESLTGVKYIIPIVVGIAARLPKPLQHKPSGVLADPDLLSKLKTRDAFPRGHEQVHRVQPLVQRNVRPPEDRPSPHSKIKLASVTAIEPVFPCCKSFAGFARGALRTIRPKAIFEVQPRGCFVREEFAEFEGADRRAGHLVELQYIGQLGESRFPQVRRQHLDIVWLIVIAVPARADGGNPILIAAHNHARDRFEAHSQGGSQAMRSGPSLVVRNASVIVLMHNERTAHPAFLAHGARY